VLKSGCTDHERYSYGSSENISPLCGKQVFITNAKNNQNVTVTIADDCPSCDNANSLDLSQVAFNSIATEEEGKVPSACYHFSIFGLALKK